MTFIVKIIITNLKLIQGKRNKKYQVYNNLNLFSKQKQTFPKIMVILLQQT